jgi:molybdopterin-guanine dinucleotide biosynthesis protein A
MPQPAPHPPVIGVLLAGGLSRRMGGGDKSLKQLATRPMLAHVIERLRPQVTALVLNANGDPARFAEFGLPVVADPVEGFVGPLAGVLAGMRWAAANAPGAGRVVSAATDTPFLPSDLVERFLDAARNEPQRIVLACSGGELHPVFGLWPIVLADDLEAALRAGTRKVLDWTDRHDTQAAEFGPQQLAGRLVDPFFNANRPEELAEAERLLGAAG